MQDELVDDIIYGVEDLVAYASTVTELRPGDILLTGSPGGNAGHHGNRWLRPGDVMEAEITGLGIMRNRCAADPAGDDGWPTATDPHATSRRRHERDATALARPFGSRRELPAPACAAGRDPPHLRARPHDAARGGARQGPQPAVRARGRGHPRCRREPGRRRGSTRSPTASSAACCSRTPSNDAVASRRCHDCRPRLPGATTPRATLASGPLDPVYRGAVLSLPFEPLPDRVGGRRARG